ncbi:uncharacterized protein LOC141607571 [Silene latifolia]|uniref:uncharacterized protein LOC141607571 n=1 Tax=Silene latifolia TaxID=37657 RepID=UPI003D77D695
MDVVQVDELGTEDSFHFTLVYALNGVQERKMLWYKLGQFCSCISGSWIICGNFNIVLRPSERLGGQSTEEEMKDFHNCVDQCNVIDIAASRSFFTWNNEQEANTRVYIRLDRALVNYAWMVQKSDYYAHFHVEGAWQLLEFIQENFRTGPTNVELIVTEITAIKDYQELHKACDNFLLQKSKVVWLQEGDSNSKLFHSYIKRRHERNKVLRIADEHGSVVTDSEQIQNAFLPFYKQLLGKEDKVQAVNSQVVQRGAVYGYSSAFFKDAWIVAGADVGTMVGDFFRNGKLLKQVNHTFVTLIPKVEISDNVTQFRLANVLRSIISPNQGGFIKGRNIIGNILMMHALNFPAQFMKMIMECVTSTFYSLVLNGEPFGFFKGKKGLRQGDPLSPLLFTIAMEYMSRILHFTTEVLDFRFHSLCSKLKLQILMFADDLLQFSKGDKKFRADIDHIITILECVQGNLPFKYFGVPITAGKLGKKDCQVLVEKIVEDIRSSGARKILYAGNWHKEQKVGWARLIWNRECLPKHSFLCWLMFRNALNVKEKLFRYGVSENDKCCICFTGTKTVGHPFQQCSYTRLVIEGVFLHLHIPVPTGNSIIWIGRRKWTAFKKSMCFDGCHDWLLSCVAAKEFSQNRGSFTET